MRFFDLHCDTATVCAAKKTGLRGDTMVSLDRRAGIDRWVEVFAIWLSSRLPETEAHAAYRRYLVYFHELAEREADALAICRTPDEMERAAAAGRCAAVLAIENGSALGGRLESVGEVARDGVKLITITWNGENALGYGSDVGGRLKPFGRQAVPEMLRHGIVPDLSHLSDEGVEDVFALTGAPVVATHSNLRTVCGHRRNLREDQFAEIVRRGGLVGLNLYTAFLRTDQAAVSWDDLFRQVDRMLELGGADTVAFGSDFDGARMPDFCRGLQDIPQVYARCAARYGETQAGKLFYENASAFFARTFRTEIR